MASFRGGRSQLKMSEEMFDFVCTACADDNQIVEAVKYCVGCSGYCCQPCTDAHKKFPTLKSHSLLEVTQGPQAGSQQSTLLELPIERCSIHKAKVMDMYCEGHDAIGCYICIAEDHKSCPDNQILSIPDMIDTLFNSSDCKHTQGLVKNMVTSMETVSKSKDTLLKSSNEEKKEALDKVTTFQKALEAIVRKAGESSRQEVEAVFKQRETEILNDKGAVDDIKDDLKTTDSKINESGENRAQRFVCWKILQEKMTEADVEKIKQELQHGTDVQISFVPDQSLLEHFQGLQGIGQVQNQTKQKQYLYKIKKRKDINIKLPDDSKLSCSFGCCLTLDDKLLVTDRNNEKLKLIDIQKMSVVDHCRLDSQPNGVCCISKYEVAVACQNASMIQFVSTHNKMTPTRQLKTLHRCYGIAFNSAKLYVTDGSQSLYIYAIAGTLLKTTSTNMALRSTQVTVDDKIRHISFNVAKSKIFVGTGNIDDIACFDGKGNHMSLMNDTTARYADGVCVDGRGNVFVAGLQSHNVIQYSEDGKKVGAVVERTDGLAYPRAVCFHPATNRLFVTLDSGNVVKMFELV